MNLDLYIRLPYSDVVAGSITGSMPAIIPTSNTPAGFMYLRSAARVDDFAEFSIQVSNILLYHLFFYNLHIILVSIE